MTDPSDAELLELCDELERRHKASGYAVGTYDLTKLIAAARRSVEQRTLLADLADNHYDHYSIGEALAERLLEYRDVKRVPPDAAGKE